MTTLEKLKADYAKDGCRCVKEKGNKKELGKFEKFYFMVDDYTTVLESGYYCLAGDYDRMFSFFSDYYEDIPDDIMAEIKKNKHLSYYLQFTQRKGDLKK
ncbi:hypothetical protein [Campylobacter sp.]|uniref:hypothetical protein n=1 Tax=Campylobacter sp. TaxID=205 RepID=UPI002AA5E547|nr:hypothetical protein [Campylobacter sp.]MCI6662301.1 hypothetical protein [Campylobacter sp.]MCI7549739.1 hypothetical protein [Campylobacter sp.]